MGYIGALCQRHPGSVCQPHPDAAWHGLAIGVLPWRRLPCLAPKSASSSMRLPDAARAGGQSKHRQKPRPRRARRSALIWPVAIPRARSSRPITSRQTLISSAIAKGPPLPAQRDDCRDFVVEQHHAPGLLSRGQLAAVFRQARVMGDIGALPATVSRVVPRSSGSACGAGCRSGCGPWHGLLLPEVFAGRGRRTPTVMERLCDTDIPQTQSPDTTSSYFPAQK
jgi:hypothetical protein